MSEKKEQALLSIADLARHFSCPESTCRYYCNRFATYMPSIGEGRRKKYRPEALEVIKVILQEIKKARKAKVKVSCGSLETILAELFPRNALSVKAVDLPVVTNATTSSSLLPSAALQLLERQALAMEGILKILRTFSKQQETQERKKENKDLAFLHDEIDKLHLLLDASEKTQQADLEQLRTWMARLINKDKKTSS